MNAPIESSAAAGGVLADPQEQQARVAALNAAHVAPLEAYRLTLGERPFAPPHFDPFDGGVEARLLVLLETPGPSRAHVRFVSRDSPTGTAANLRRAFASAALDRRETVLWNTIPWVRLAPGDRNRPPRRNDLAAGLEALPALLQHLPRLRAVVLAGRTARAATSVFAEHAPTLRVSITAHPSPTYVNTRPGVLVEIIEAIRAAAASFREP